jgi:nucleotide-binding universal stress UspA family protein
VNSGTLRPTLRWLLWSHRYEAELVAEERNRIRKETVQKVEAAADSALRRRIRKIHVEFANPLKAIVDFANRLKADAIVMGIRSGGELTRASTHIPWALAHRVITEAACPVLTIRS